VPRHAVSPRSDAERGSLSEVDTSVGEMAGRLELVDANDAAFVQHERVGALLAGGPYEVGERVVSVHGR